MVATVVAQEERWAAGVKKVMVAAERTTAVAATATAVKVQVVAGMGRVAAAGEDAVEMGMAAAVEAEMVAARAAVAAWREPCEGDVDMAMEVALAVASMGLAAVVGAAAA